MVPTQEPWTPRVNCWRGTLNSWARGTMAAVRSGPTAVGVSLVYVVGRQMGGWKVELASYAATAIRNRHRKHLLLPSRPIVGIVWRVGRLWDQHHLARRVKLEKSRASAVYGLGVLPSELLQGRCSRDMLELVVF